MKEANDKSDPDRVSGSVDAFEDRAQKILDQLDRADKILDNLRTKKKKPDRAADVFDEVLDSLERGIKKLFNAALSQGEGQADTQKREKSAPLKLGPYLDSCSDEELKAIRYKIDEILKERSSGD